MPDRTWSQVDVVANETLQRRSTSVRCFVEISTCGCSTLVRLKASN